MTRSETRAEIAQGRRSRDREMASCSTAPNRSSALPFDRDRAEMKSDRSRASSEQVNQKESTGVQKKAAKQEEPPDFLTCLGAAADDAGEIKTMGGARPAVRRAARSGRVRGQMVQRQSTISGRAHCTVLRKSPHAGTGTQRAREPFGLTAAYNDRSERRAHCP